MSFLMPSNCAALVLAAGKGTRMHSQRPKVLQKILGEPMLFYVLDALKGFATVRVVAGHGMEFIEDAFPLVSFIRQEPQLGTGHAVICALEDERLRTMDYLLVLNGDAPLVTTEVLEGFVEQSIGADLSFATITPPDCAQYGRVIRKNGKPVAIVEARDFDPLSYKDFSGEVNAGIYFLRTSLALELLPKIGKTNKSAEYYLTDLVDLAVNGKYDVRAICCGEDASFTGVNTPWELSQTEELMRERKTERLLASGVILHAPQLVRCGPLAKIEPGCEISGPCEIFGETIVSEGAVIESHCVISGCKIGNNARIRSFTHMEDAIVGANAQVGPYARLRPGSRLMQNSHVGNFVELKKTILGEGSKANHLSYLGDSEIGPLVNIGAGTITCNYDGKNKHRTVIGEGAFIGSNTALVAPVSIGQGSLVGAGSVITHDVPENELGIARARQKNLRRRS